MAEPTENDEMFALHGEPFDGERIVFRDQDGTVNAAFDLLRLGRLPWYLSPPALLIAAGLLALTTGILVARRLIRALAT